MTETGPDTPDGGYLTDASAGQHSRILIPGDGMTIDREDDRLTLAAGGGGGSSIPTGDGPPNDTVTPSDIGALYLDTANGALFIAIGLTSADWYMVGGEGGSPSAGFVGTGRDEGVLHLIGGRVGQSGTAVAIGDTVGQDADNGSGNGVSWLTGDDDGEQALQITTGGPSIDFNTWAFDADGRFLLAGGGAGALLSITNGASSAGTNGDWGLGADGHIYFKAAGSWVQKV